MSDQVYEAGLTFHHDGRMSANGLASTASRCYGDAMGWIPDVSVIPVHDVPLTRSDEENIAVAILPDTPFTSAAVGYVSPGAVQTPHYHDRPDDGDEIIYLYRGTFRLITDGRRSEPHDTARTGPVYVAVKAGTVASIENCGTEDVAFFAVFAPMFRPGEIRYVT